MSNWQGHVIDVELIRFIVIFMFLMEATGINSRGVSHQKSGTFKGGGVI